MKKFDKLLVTLPILIILICLMIFQISSPVQSKALATDVVEGLRVEPSRAQTTIVVENLDREEELLIAVTALDKDEKNSIITPNDLSRESDIDQRLSTSLSIGARIISANPDGQSPQKMYEEIFGYVRFLKLFKQKFLSVFEPLGYTPEYLQIAF